MRRSPIPNRMVASILMQVLRATARRSVSCSHAIRYLCLTLIASRFFVRKNDKIDKPLPAPPSNASSSTLALDAQAQIPQSQDEAAASNSSFRFPQPSAEASSSAELLLQIGGDDDLVSPDENARKVKPRPSFSNLRSKSERSHLSFAIS